MSDDNLHNSNIRVMGDIKDFKKCTVEEIMEFKSLVDEVYGPEVFYKTVGEDLAKLSDMFEKMVGEVVKGKPDQKLWKQVHPKILLRFHQ